MTRKKTYIMGVDLGQTADFTAVAVLDVVGPVDLAGKPIIGEYDYQCVYLERYPLGMPYTEMVRKIRDLLFTPELAGRCVLVVDATGVGAPVIDLLYEAGLQPISIVIHGGKALNHEEGSNVYYVPKRDIIDVVKILIEQKRLGFAQVLPDTVTLAKEMIEYQVKIDPQTAHDSYNARQGAHDDYILAVALPVWYLEKAPVVYYEVGFLPPIHIGNY